ncbi:protein FAM161A isoform X3 [Microplitis mediator]|uniref:protein FAM161A isoform X3 n=1 Tax=Microplitis mediator TaxID=375433 RepID=UPI00255389EC|nr:protein FAM161A isoform X3 [Microplitis mediator]
MKVRMPIDPYSRQPTPSYERPRIQRVEKRRNNDKSRKINFVSSSSNQDSNREIVSSDDSNVESFLDFLESIPDYGEVNHLSNEQFKQKLDYLKRKQRLLLKNLKNCLDQDESDEKSLVIQDKSSTLPPSTPSIPDKSKRWDENNPDLKLLGKKCSLEDSRTGSPLLFSSGTFAGLAEDQDLLTFRCKDKDKEMKTLRNREIYSAGKSWSTWSESKSTESANSDSENSVETRSLPPSSPKRWQPTVPKPFSFALRDDAEKYMSRAEKEATEKFNENNKGGPTKKRRVRPIPLTSRIPLYDKLMAAKEERSRMIREEAAWSLMSQVKPFRLECDRRAVKAMSRSSPELCTKNVKSISTSRFRAKPVPKDLFGTDVYDRMLEDEYFRQMQKKIRAAELMKSSSLPPSMARRERIKSACIPRARNCSNDECRRNEESLRVYSSTPMTSERSRSVMTNLSGRGNNLAAILRCQASREKLEREIQEKMEEKAREYAIRMRESWTGRKPAWRALRHAARKDLERDLDFRISLRRDEAREQAERHRFEMEMMLDRVTQIPTLFERHSQTRLSKKEYNMQNFQAMRQLQSRAYKLERKKKKKKPKSEHSSSLDSDNSPGCPSRPDSGSFINIPARSSPGQSSKSSGSRKSQISTRSDNLINNKKKNERGPLRVSINETAELIEDHDEDRDNNERYSSSPSDERDPHNLCNNNTQNF